MEISMSKNESRRRFSNQQIQLLESMFETDSRPELRMKQQVANRLGLQPRQVAIWFQNKRARSKSRQLEQEYCKLKTNYNDLSLKFEILKKENQSLLTQSLRNQTPNHQACRNVQMTQRENSSSQEHNSQNITTETEEQYDFLSEIPYNEDSSASVAHYRESEILDIRGFPHYPCELMENTSYDSGLWKI